MSSTPSPVRRSMLRILLAVAVIATVLPFGAAPALAAGNQAVQLDGINDHVDLGASSTSLGANQFTLELWFKRTGTGVLAQTGVAHRAYESVVPLITKGRRRRTVTPVTSRTSWGSTRPNRRRPTQNALAADFEDAAGGANHGFSGTTPVPMNVWTHAAVTYDGSVCACT